QISNYVIVTPQSMSAFIKMNGKESRDYDDTYAKLYTSKPSQEALFLNYFLDKYSFIDPFFKFNQWKIFLENLDTNLSQSQLISTLNLLKAKMSNGSVDLIDLGQDKYIHEYMDSKLDRQIPVLDLNAFDQALNQYIDTVAPRKVSTEQVKVEIYNASVLNGLAYRYARKIGNSGINVIRFESSPKNYDNTVIYVPKLEGFKNSLELLEKIIGGKYTVVEGRPDFITTGDIIIILGNDRSTDNGNF
ncbi:MAG TPA: LytR C-terminal domain-containing protein, partial [Candidatus Dojkabacteria bacterium]|nr:LytR C-terminal domain-containing protein [Candidatus Dojkabacteria bacterium]